MNNTLYAFFSSIPLLVSIKKRIDQGRMFVDRLKQCVKKYARVYGFSIESNGDGLHLAIVIVKRPVYLQLAIQNINSLHYFSTKHKFTLYCDSVCYKEFMKLKHQLDYPELVNAMHFFKKVSQPWQISKVEALIDASKKGFALTDADGIWTSNPSIDKKKVTFLVKAGTFIQNQAERDLIVHEFKHKDWSKLTHYVTGFISIPSHFMNAKLQKDLRTFTRRILDNDNPTLRRLAEEIGVSLAVQKHIKRKNISTLKQEDGPGNREILQSMYYGCANEILE